MPIHPSLLRQFELLRSLADENAQSLALLSHTREFAKRELVLEKNRPANYLCFLLDGKLQALDFTLDGKEVGIYFVNEGEYFGEIDMLDGVGQPEMIIAIKKSTVVMVPALAMKRVMFSSPGVMEGITRGLTRRIRRQSQQQQLLAVNHPVQRIVLQLQTLAQPNGKLLQIVNVPTHQELAIMVNLTRETVTRAFQVLQARGALLRDGDNLIIMPDKIHPPGEQSPE